MFVMLIQNVAHILVEKAKDWFDGKKSMNLLAKAVVTMRNERDEEKKDSEEDTEIEMENVKLMLQETEEVKRKTVVTEEVIDIQEEELIPITYSYDCEYEGKKGTISMNVKKVKILDEVEVDFEDIEEFSGVKGKKNTYKLMVESEYEGEAHHVFEVTITGNSKNFVDMYGKLHEYDSEEEDHNDTTYIYEKVGGEKMETVTEKEEKGEEQDNESELDAADFMVPLNKSWEKSQEIVKKQEHFLQHIFDVFVKYRLTYTVIPICLFICNMLALYTHTEVIEAFWPMFGRLEIFGIPGLLMVLITVAAALFMFLCFTPLLHRAANFGKLFSFLFFFAIIFSLVLGCLFPYSKESPKWTSLEVYLENKGDVIPWNTFVNDEVFDAESNSTIELPRIYPVVLEEGDAWAFMHASDSNKLKKNHRAFRYYKEHAGESGLRCMDNGTCFVNIPVDDEMSRVQSISLFEGENRTMEVEILLNDTWWSHITIEGNFHPYEWDEETSDGMRYVNGTFYRVNTHTNAWRGSFTVNQMLTFKISTVYNKRSDVPFLKKWYEHDDWMDMTGKERPQKRDDVEGRPFVTYNWFIQNQVFVISV